MKWIQAACAALGMTLGMATACHAQAWTSMATISGTLGNNLHRLCVGAPSAGRPDIGCPADAPLLHAGGLQVSGIVTATYFEGDGSRLTGLGGGGGGVVTDRISSSNSQAMVLTTPAGTVSITTGNVGGTSYFDTLGRWVGPGISVTAMHGISSTNGYFSNRVGIGTSAPERLFHVQGADAIWRLDRDANTVGLQLHRFPSDDFSAPWKGFLLGVAASGANDGYFTIADYGQNVTGAVSHRLLIDTVGNIGIGTATPSAKLDVAGHVIISNATSRTLSFGNVGTGGPSIGSAGMKVQLYGDDPNAMGATDYAMGVENHNLWFNSGGNAGSFKWYNRSNEQMRLDADGRLGVGNPIPRAQLDVTGNISASGAIQIGSYAICSVGVPGALRYSGGNMEYCNGSSWTSLSSNTAPGGGSVDGSGATNHIAYWSGATTLAHDAGQLYWDATNNRVGIGLNNPARQLHISASSSPGIRFTAGASPTNHLDIVVGSETYDISPLPEVDSANVMLRFFRSTNTTGSKFVSFLRGDNTTTTDARISVDGGHSYFQSGGGNLGIGQGATTPGAKLTVYTNIPTNDNSTVSATEVLRLGFNDRTDAGSGTDLGPGNGTKLAFYAPSNNSWATHEVAHISTYKENGTEDNLLTSLLLGTHNGTSADERVRITSMGNVGIGNSAPSAMLSVGDGAIGTTSDVNEIIVQSRGFAGLKLQGDYANTGGEPGGSYVYFSQDGPAGIAGVVGLVNTAGGDTMGGAYTSTLGNALLLGGLSNAALQLGTNGVAQMTILANGYVGLGPNNPNINLAIGDSDTGINWVSDGVLAIHNNNSERMRFASNGNMGIGTTTPNAKLTLGGTAGSNGGIYIATSTSRTLAFGTVGTGVPAAGSNGLKVQLYGSNPGVMATGDYAIGIEGNNMWFNTGGTGANGFKWYSAGTHRMTLDGNGNLTAVAFLYSSDKRLKKDVASLTGGLAKFDAIDPISFRFTSDRTGRKHLGVIAQEVEEVFPEAVITDAKGMKQVDYAALVAPLIGAVKELRAENQALRLQLEAANENQRRAMDELRTEVRALRSAGVR